LPQVLDMPTQGGVVIDILEYYTPDPDIGLFGGRWVPNGKGTLDWVQEREPAPLPQRQEPVERPTTRLCKHCENEFTFSKHRQKYCSDECKHEGGKARHRNYMRASRSCESCGGACDRKAKRCKVCANADRRPDGTWAA